MIITNSRFFFVVGYTNFGNDGNQELTNSNRNRICELRDALHEKGVIRFDEVFHPPGASSQETAQMLVDTLAKTNQVANFTGTGEESFDIACVKLIASCGGGNLEHHSMRPEHHLVHEVALRARSEIEDVLGKNVDGQSVLIIGTPIIINALIVHLFPSQPKVVAGIWGKYLKPGSEIIEVRAGSDPAEARLDWAADFHIDESEVG